jgi:cell division protein FtsI/penicillin-binding protein 2
VVGMTTGITSTQWKGTAQGSCRVVFGSCPAAGLPDLAGKTGTADFLTGEDSPYVKDGLQIPAKLFGGVFTAQGKRWAVAVMALRNRAARGTSLDLQSSAAAEAGLTLVREMRRP